jgi:N-acetylglutamate synthase-like GNAT family acetyltransferase
MKDPGAATAAGKERATIRRARPGDAAAVRQLVRQLGYAPDDRNYDETFAQVVRHPEAAVFIAQMGTRVVGYLAMSHRPQIRLASRLASIDEIAVEDSERGRGIGSELLGAAVAHARSLHCVRVDVQTSRSRGTAVQTFYAERGLSEIDSLLFRQTLPKP